MPPASGMSAGGRILVGAPLMLGKTDGSGLHPICAAWWHLLLFENTTLDLTRNLGTSGDAREALRRAVVRSLAWLGNQIYPVLMVERAATPSRRF